MQSPLKVEEEQRRSDLAPRLIVPCLSHSEVQELRNLLEREKHMITEQGNYLALLAITFLTSYVEEYLEARRSNSLLTSET
jgi:hypothetical protein